MIVWHLLDVFRAHFKIEFVDGQRRLTRCELTANTKNIQISAEICKNQTRTKNADTKTPIDNFTICRMQAAATSADDVVCLITN